MKQKLTATKETNFGIARKIVSNMTSQSWEEIPHCAVTYEPEVTELMKIVKEINAGKTREEKLTINTIMLRIIVEGIKACPEINAHLNFNRKLVRGTYTQFKEINISLPMVLDNGEMMTINLHNFHNKTMSEMRDEINDVRRRIDNSDMNEVMFEVSLADTLTGLANGKIIQAIRRLYGSKMPGKHQVKLLKGDAKKKYYSIPEKDRLTKHDIEQGTITVSNLGSIYRKWEGVCTLLQIIPPQVAVIAIGSAQNVPIAEADGTVRTGLKLPMTIGFDHRAVDYGDIVPFMERLDEIFKNPEIIKEWI